MALISDNPRVASLRRFIESCVRLYSRSGASISRCWRSGTPVKAIILPQYLADEHPEIVQNILQRLAERVPKLEHVDSEQTIDGRLALLFKDAPFTNNAIKLRVFTQVCPDKI